MLRANGTPGFSFVWLTANSYEVWIPKKAKGTLCILAGGKNRSLPEATSVIVCPNQARMGFVPAGGRSILGFVWVVVAGRLRNSGMVRPGAIFTSGTRT